MSTKTTFKRVALVAVAALGLGVMSVAPSSAATSGLTVTGTNGTAGNTAGAIVDTTTAALATVNALTTETNDTITVSMIRKSAPSAGAAITAHLGFVDTGTVSTGVKRTVGGSALVSDVAGMNVATVFDSTTAVSTGASQAYVISGAVGYKTATFSVLIDTTTAPAAGAYVYTIVTQVYSAAGAFVSQALTDVTLTVAALASASTVVDPSQSSATLSEGASWSGAVGTDSAVATLATVSATVKGVIRVINENASGSAVAESITVTVTGPGFVRKNGDSSAGKSIIVIGDGNDDIEILSDGTAGTSSISVKTTSVTHAAKSVTFFAASAATAVAAANKPVIAVGTNTNVIAATLKDANGSNWAGTAYIWAASAADALLAGSETAAACTYSAALSAHLCDVAGKLAGTANFIVADSDSKTATTTTKSNSVGVRVSAGAPTTVKLAFDKATYAPGEKAQVQVLVLDAAGLPLAEQTVNNLFATGGITSSTALGTGSDTLTATFANIAGATSAAAGTVVHHQVYTVYMPMASGDVTLSATGSTGLASAGRVAVSATASVVNTSVDAATDAANEATDAANAATDAALASADAADAATAAAQDASDAVAALSTRVSELIKDLRKQIRELTKLVQRLL